jgi:predicted acyl esterase
VLGKELDASAGLMFESAPFAEGGEVSGMFSGELHVTTNVRDFDYSVTLYERLPTGELFHLSYVIGRASLAADPTTRTLLEPGVRTVIRFDRSRATSRRLQPGSRLVAVVTVNKNMFAQVNHGTGGDVSDERASDAGTPMRVQWHSDSYLSIPFARPGPDDAP